MKFKSKEKNMELDEIKDKIGYFKAEVIDNVEYHINDYFADDFIDAGMVEYIIDDYEIYFYWMEKARELSEFMDILINYFHEREPEKKSAEDLSKIYDHLIECVDIKRVIDKNLINSRDYNKQEVKEWMGLKVKKELKSNFIPITENNNQEIILSELFKLLKNKGYINIQSKDFENHFKPVSHTIKKIQWLGTEIQISALIHLMITKGIIPKSQLQRKAKLIVGHFVNRNGKDFRERQLGVVLSRVNTEDERHLFTDIIEIVEELAKIN